MLGWIIGKVNGLLSGLSGLTGLVGVEIPLIPTLATGSEVMTASPEPPASKSNLGVTPAPTMLAPMLPTPAASPMDSFKPTPSGSVVNTAVTSDRSSRSVHIDRSIRDVRIEIHAGGQDSRSIKEQLTEFFNELAAQGDAMEGVAFDGR